MRKVYRTFVQSQGFKSKKAKFKDGLIGWFVEKLIRVLWFNHLGSFCSIVEETRLSKVDIC